MNCKALLRARPWLRRILEVTIDGEMYVVDYYGCGINYEAVLVDGVVVSKHSCGFGLSASRFQFALGSHLAEIRVRVSLWYTLRAMELKVDNRLVYLESSGVVNYIAGNS